MAYQYFLLQVPGRVLMSAKMASTCNKGALAFPQATALVRPFYGLLRVFDLVQFTKIIVIDFISVYMLSTNVIRHFEITK